MFSWISTISSKRPLKNGENGKGKKEKRTENRRRVKKRKWALRKFEKKKKMEPVCIDEELDQIWFDVWVISIFQMFLSLQRNVFPENFSLKKLRSNLKENYNWRVYEHVWLTCCLVEGYIRTEARLGRGCRKEGTQLQAYKQYQGWL